VKLRVARAAREKRLEDEALLKLQSVVEEMQQLKESLIAAVRTNPKPITLIP